MGGKEICHIFSKVHIIFVFNTREDEQTLMDIPMLLAY